MALFRLIFLFGFFLLANSIQAQNWVQLNSPTSNGIYNLFFVTPEIGYSAGEGGEIFKTIDGGITWTNVSAPSNTVDLYRIYFIDDQNGFVIGNSGVCLRTANGGDDWTNINFSTTANFREIRFRNSTDGVILGSPAFIATTTDGGNTWQTPGTSISEGLRGARFHNDMLYFLGWNNHIYESDFPSIDYSMYTVDVTHPIGLEFMENAVSLCGGQGGELIRTENAWQDYETVWSDPEYSLADFARLTNEHLFVVANKPGVSGHLLESMDGGLTWEMITLDTAPFWALCQAGPNTAYAGCFDGSLWKYTLNTTKVISNSEKSLSLSVFPNPASDLIQVHLENAQPGKQHVIQLFDVLGRHIQEYTIPPSGIIVISTEALPCGLYVFKLAYGTDEYLSRSIVVE
jgi:hypothetical protein